MEYLIRNGRVLTEHGFEQINVAVSEGKIVCESQLSANAEVIDAQGCIVAPGYIDMHIHGIAGGTSMHGEEEVRIMAKALAQHGVTGFLPTPEAAPGEIAREALAGIEKCMNGKSGGAAVLGAHMEGPFMGAELRGALDDKAFLQPSVEAFETLCGEYVPVVKRMTMDPTLPGALELIRALTQRGIKISVGHTVATADLADQAFEAGANIVTHLFNAMRPLHHREPYLLGAALASDTVTCELICDFIHVDPRVIKLAIKAKGRKAALISDAISATSVGDGEYMLGGRPVIVKDGIARVPEGNLAGSTLTMDAAVRNVVSLGFPVEEVLRMASENVADALGMPERGRIACGCWGDIILLDEDLNVCATMVEGNWVYKK